MVSFTITLDLDKSYSDEEILQKLQMLGELIINRVKENIRAMDLVNTGQFLQGWSAKASSSKLTIENTQKYADYLEFGTYNYFEEYGLDDFPEVPDPKKKDVSVKESATLPRGMQPFSPVRRVIYNETILTELITIVFKE